MFDDQAERERTSKVLARIAASQQEKLPKAKTQVTPKPQVSAALEECPKCKARVRADRLLKHIKLHLRGIKRKTPPARKTTLPGASIATCPKCKSVMRADALRNHTILVHETNVATASIPDSPSHMKLEPIVPFGDQTVRCELCGRSIARKFLKDHRRTVHKRQQAARKSKKKQRSEWSDNWRLVQGGLPSLGKRR